MWLPLTLTLSSTRQDKEGNKEWSGLSEEKAEKLLRLIQSPYWVMNRLAGQSICVRVNGPRTEDMIVHSGVKEALPRAWAGRKPAGGSHKSRRRASSHDAAHGGFHDADATQLVQVGERSIGSVPALRVPCTLRLDANVVRHEAFSSGWWRERCACLSLHRPHTHRHSPSRWTSSMWICTRITAVGETTN